MPPPQNQDNAPSASNERKPLDVDSLLLPKKQVSGTTPQSAQRINAGALFAQEQQAAAPTPKPVPAARPASVPPLGSAPKPAIAPIQTYKGDIERVVEEGESVVSMAAAEAKRRDEQGRAPSEAAAPHQKSRWRRMALYAGGSILTLAALSAVAYLAMRDTSLKVAPAPVAPFIAVDDTVLVSAPSGVTRENLMTDLIAARQRSALSLGLVEWLYIARPAATPQDAPIELTSRELLSTLGRGVPETLLRTLTPRYLLGVHSFDENQPLLILEVDSYESAYAGMLGWERTMKEDLSPLFTRSPSPHTSVGSVGTSPNASSTPLTDADFIQSGFVDQVVENRDARVMLNAQGDILLLWTFLDRHTILITTNEYTLREVLSRLSSAPVTHIPGQ